MKYILLEKLKNYNEIYLFREIEIYKQICFSRETKNYNEIYLYREIKIYKEIYSSRRK
uniref:Uncharacterized protein n=1 Tax=viral metagenome TaxID=1070528 RepID=A0A6C0ADW4_9ZZZZ